MKRNFSWMKAQQAPPPRQARLFGAVQTASSKAQRKTGGIVTARKAAASKVRIELKTLLNRLARSQPIRPAAAGGGGSAIIGRSCVTSVIRHRPTAPRDPEPRPLSALRGGRGRGPARSDGRVRWARLRTSSAAPPT